MQVTLVPGAVEQIFGQTSGSAYASVTCGRGDCSSCFSPELRNTGQIQAFACDPSSVRPAKAAKTCNDVQLFPIEDFVACSTQEPHRVAGVFIHLGDYDDELTSHQIKLMEDGPLDLRVNQTVGLSASAVLQTLSSADFAEILDSFGSLQDPLLATRFAEAFLNHQRSRGPFVEMRDFVTVFECLRPDFEEDHPNLRIFQLLRALSVAVNRIPEMLDRVLSVAFERLVPFGRCVIVTFNPWEHASLQRFVHSFEEPPPCFAMLHSIEPTRLAELYPLLASNANYTIRWLSNNGTLSPGSAGEAAVDNGRCGRVCVLEKLPRMSDPKALLSQPQFIGLSEPPEGTSPSSELHAGTESDDLSVEEKKAQLSRAIALRKHDLKEAGHGAGKQKKDPELAELVKQLGSLYCTTPEYVEKLQRRCRDRRHVSVLLDEAVDSLLALGPSDVYIDGTFGRGGHSRLILERLSDCGRLKAFDMDPLAVQVGRTIQQDDRRFEIIHQPFGEMLSALQAWSPQRDGSGVAGILLDLGVSTPQLEDSCRGFSAKARKHGPLDLRMNQDMGQPASEWLSSVTPKQLAQVIGATCYRLEAPLPERIAEVILQQQKHIGSFTSTAQLARVLDDFSATLGVERPKTSLAHIVFCSIRVFLNQEMEQLELALHAAFEILKPYGRCVIICFNRWERAAVRKFIRRHEEPRSVFWASFPKDQLAKLFPLLADVKGFHMRQACRPIRPSAEELARNPRAKSMMYVLEKVARAELPWDAD